MQASATARRVLQAAVAIGGLVPFAAGISGILLGTGMADGGGSIDLDSHLRYLSGLLFAIGLSFWSCIPRIEQHRDRFLLLTLIVFAGGLSRLYGILHHAVPSGAMLGGLAMELVVTPGLCLWQRRLSGVRRTRPGKPDQANPAAQTPLLPSLALTEGSEEG